MNEYEVTISLECTYTVSAPDETSAADIACGWFDEAEPIIEVKEIKEN